MRFRNSSDSVRSIGVSLAAVVQGAMWLDVGNGNHSRQACNLKGNEGLDLGRRQRLLDAAKPGSVVVPGMRADLDSELAAPPCCRDRDGHRACMSSARDAGAVDHAEDGLVGSGAFADVRVEIHLMQATSVGGVAVQELDGVIEGRDHCLERFRRSLHTAWHVDDK